MSIHTLISKKSIVTGVLCILAFLPSCASHKPSMKGGAMARLQLGVTHLQQGNASKALAEFFEGERIEPRNTKIKNAIALAYMKMGNFDVAEGYLKKAIEIDPEYSEGYNNLGLLYSYRGESAKAVVNYKKALKNVVSSMS